MLRKIAGAVLQLFGGKELTELMGVIRQSSVTEGWRLVGVKYSFSLYESDSDYIRNVHFDSLFRQSRVHYLKAAWLLGCKKGGGGEAAVLLLAYLHLKIGNSVKYCQIQENN